MECAGRALSGDGALAPGVANSVPYLLRRLLARVAARRASPRAAHNTRRPCPIPIPILKGLDHSARGCSRRATPGGRWIGAPTLNGLHRLSPLG